MFTPPALAPPGEVTITPWSYQSLGPALQLLNVTVGAAAWPAAGLAIFVPFWVPEASLVTKLFASIGAAAGNIDLGIYAEDQTLLASAGSTAVTATNDLQVVDITDITLARGRYYMALCCDTVTTLTVLRSNVTAGVFQSIGVLEQASITLPLSTGASPATFAKYTRTYLPMFGLQLHRSFGP